MKIYDISKILDENTLIYPENEGITIKKIKDAQDGGWNLTAFSMGTHSGTHLDSPLHLGNGKKGVLDIPLDKLYGECVVLDLTDIEFGNGITAKILETHNDKIMENDIVLCKTKNSFLDESTFRKDFIFLDETGATFLVKKKIKCFAIDYLSVGPRNPHEILIFNDIAVFENVTLKNIHPKRYQFIGLPIKIKLEGAPARVILVEN